MALHTKKQFAELVGKTTKEISVYESRGKVVYSGDYVDDSIQPNIDFMRRCLEKSKDKLSAELESTGVNVKEVLNVESNNKRVIAEPAFRTPKPPKVKAADEGGGSRYEASKLGEILKNEKLEEEIEILREKRNKLQGANIPKEPVVLSFQYINKNMCRNIKVGMENLITRYEKNFTPAQFADVRAAIVKEINHAQTNAVAESKKNIAEIILISSSKKEVGERE
jgi:hypothetical protein